MERDLLTLGFILMFIGIMVIVIASMIMIFSRPLYDGDKINVGGCIIIFFIPICFGYGHPWIMIFTIALTIVLVIILFLLPYIIYKRSIKTYS